MGSLERYHRRPRRLERDELMNQDRRDALVRKLQETFDPLTVEKLGEVLCVQSDIAEGYEPVLTDAWRKWRALGGPPVWAELERTVLALWEQNAPVGGLLRELGTEGERDHIAMSALERRDERLAKLEER